MSKSRANGEGTLYYSKSEKKWVGQYIVANKRKTIRQRKNEKVTDFKKRFNATIAKINEGIYIDKSRDTLYSIMKRHIEQKYKDGITSARSYIRNIETLAQIEQTCSSFIYSPIQKVQAEHIEDCKEGIKEYGKSCIDKIWTLLRKGFKIAYSRKKVVYNIMEDQSLMKPISVKKIQKKEALSVIEEAKLISILENDEKEHKYRNIVYSQLQTGMRIGELLARSIHDADFKNNTIHVWNTLTTDENYHVILGEHTKIFDKSTGIDLGERIIPLSLTLKEVVLNVKYSNLTNIYGLLFWDYINNTFISVSEINSWLSRLNNKYSITKRKLSTHILRHTYITRLQEAGVHISVIQYLVGHVEGSSVTNNTYTSVSSTFVCDELKKIN